MLEPRLVDVALETGADEGLAVRRRRASHREKGLASSRPP